MAPMWRRIDRGHMALVAMFVGITAFYLFDAWQASSGVKNLILVLPAAVLTLILCGVVLAGIVRDAKREAAAEAGEGGGRDGAPVLLMGLFAAYILGLPWLGFDVGTALFMAASLLVDGERRPLVVVAVPVVFAGLVTALFAWLLPYPLPTLLV